MKKSICMIMCHADDIEYYAGGTLAKYIADGYRALYGVLSRCNSGFTVTPEKGGHCVSSLEIIPQRRAEAEAAAGVFGAELYYADLLENNYTLRDGRPITPSFTGAGEEGVPEDDIPEGVPIAVAAGAGIREDYPILSEVADLLVEWEPELVVGQCFQNGNPDHFAAALIVARAWRIAKDTADIGPYWVPVVPPSRGFVFPRLFPDRFVDITGHEEAALKALACHRCQGGHLPKTQEGRRAGWRSWGAVHGCTSAEAFLEAYRK